MPVREHLSIGEPARIVWPLLAEFRHWPDWGPTVTAVEADADVVAPGVRGRVRTPLGVWLPFEVTSVDPGHAWDWKVVGVPATGHVVTNTGDSTSTVEFTAPGWAPFYAPILRRGLHRLAALAKA